MPNRAMQAKALKLIKQRARAPHPVFSKRNTVGAYDPAGRVVMRFEADKREDRPRTYGDGTRLNSHGYLASAISYDPHQQWDIVRR